MHPSSAARGYELLYTSWSLGPTPPSPSQSAPITQNTLNHFPTLSSTKCHRGGSHVSYRTDLVFESQLFFNLQPWWENYLFQLKIAYSDWKPQSLSHFSLSFLWRHCAQSWVFGRWMGEYRREGTEAIWAVLTDQRQVHSHSKNK